MNFLFRLCLFTALLSTASAQFVPSAPKVAKVEIKRVGPVNVSDELIRANIRVKPGDPYQPLAVDDDVKNLYATGFFYDVRIERMATPEALVLTYIVHANPKTSALK